MTRSSTDPLDPGYLLHLRSPRCWRVLPNGIDVTSWRNRWCDLVTEQSRFVVTADDSLGRVWFYVGENEADTSPVDPATGGYVLFQASGIVQVRQVAVHEWPQGAPVPAWLRP